MPSGNFIRTEEHKKNISDALKRYYMNNSNPDCGFRKGVAPKCGFKKGVPCSYSKFGERNPFYGKHHSIETRNKISLAKKGKSVNLGRKLSEESKIKISKANKGHIAWNRGKPWSELMRKKLSESIREAYKNPEARKRLSDGIKKSFQNGRTISPENRKRLSLRLLGNKLTLGYKPSNETRKKLSLSGKGRIFSESHRKRISFSNIGKTAGNKNIHWLGGLSFQKYPQEFNIHFKRKILFRDNSTCQNCNINKNDLTTKRKILHVHHINYVKNDVNPENCISLCSSCHAKTNNSREYWKNKFEDILRKKYDYCYNFYDMKTYAVVVDV